MGRYMTRTYLSLTEYIKDKAKKSASGHFVKDMQREGKSIRATYIHVKNKNRDKA